MTDGSSLMRLLNSTVRMGHPALLMIGGTGTVSIYPRQQCYVSDVNDWDSAYAAQPGQIRVMPTAWGAPPPSGARPLEGLQWGAAYYAAVSRQPQSPLTRELLHLVEWPNLTRIPQEMMPVAARVCALLWRKPTVGFLIPRVLGLAPEQVGAVIETLQQLGHIDVPRAAAQAATPGAGAQAAAVAEPAAEPAESAAPSLVGKLWQRLLRF